jgi:hypothetical protein
MPLIKAKRPDQPAVADQVAGAGIVAGLKIKAAGPAARGRRHLDLRAPAPRHDPGSPMPGQIGMA